MPRNPRMLLATALGAGVLFFGAGAAGAQVDTYESTPPPSVIDDREEPPATPPPTVLDDEVERSTGTLPVTGGDVVGLALLGAGSITTGGAILWYRRRLTA